MYMTLHYVNYNYYEMQLSFDECKQYLFHGPIFEQFQARLEEYDVMPEIAQLFKIDEVKKSNSHALSWT